MKPYIIQYKEAIERGSIEINGETKRLVVGWKVKKAVDVLCSYLEDPRYEFEPEPFYKRLRFEESLCLQGKRPYYGKPIELMLWQKAFWEAIYSFKVKATGRRLIKSFLLEVGRKNGKSTMMAADINADLFIGEGGVRVCCASNEDKTAKFIWEEVLGMKKRLDPKDEVTSKNRTEIRNDAKDITILRMSGRAVNDGDNFYKFIQDEAWDCKTEELPEAGLRSCSTQDDYIFGVVSTNGFLNDMWFDKQLKLCNQWLNEEYDDPTFIPWLFEQDDESEVWASDHDLWQKSNPSLIYGVKKWAFIEDNIEKAKIDRETALNLMCKDFNLKVSNSRAWLTSDVYKYESEPFTLADFKGSFCVGGADLSDGGTGGDLTAAVAILMKPDSNVKFVVAQVFITEAKLKAKDEHGSKWAEWANTINPQTGKPYIIVCQGNKINQKTVADWFQSLRDEWKIEPLVIGHDPWHDDVFLQWCDRKTGYGIPTEKVYQNPKGMSYAMKCVERDLADRLIDYGDNPLMHYCFANTSAKIVQEKIMPEKIDGQYSRKIDAVVALIIAYAALEMRETEFNNAIGR